MSDIVLRAEGLVREFKRARPHWLKPRPASFRAVDGVSLAVARGRTLGVVGEFGCGKSTLARMMVGLIEPTAGTLTIDNEPIPVMARRNRRALYRRIQMVFQDPLSSLNPGSVHGRGVISGGNDGGKARRSGAGTGVVTAAGGLGWSCSTSH